jgi:hypothetical protein
MDRAKSRLGKFSGKWSIWFQFDQIVVLKSASPNPSSRSLAFGTRLVEHIYGISSFIDMLRICLHYLVDPERSSVKRSLHTSTTTNHIQPAPLLQRWICFMYGMQHLAVSRFGIPCSQGAVTCTIISTCGATQL